ncbi:MAG: MCE family protein [Propionivibrio sp.]|uniref:MCE family protein n=1 Tax=Candidatus Propionivibrio dominans TaxID=2954373 RepID=A0A9D7F4R9_9RHOO|nr:MCE family protein [Candidatus Propionivibrio dominans]MBL0166123.1 MCE family protein [Propionivibrio sp.]
MTDTRHDTDLPNLPAAVARPKRRWAPQFIWIIPIVAVLVGAGLAVKVILERGPTITISFKSGDGLEAGKTHVKYKDVDIGLVKTVALSADRNQVIASVELNREASDFLLEDTRFWIVRPRITASGVTGLGTLLAGPFIAVDVGESKSKRVDFVALDVPPIVTADTPGREFVLRASNLGSLDIGVPVYFRRLTVGEVVAYDLDKDGKGVSVRVFVHAPYDKYVTNDTRFWNASGVDVSLSAAGLQVQTESFVSILIGGIAFEAPSGPGSEIIPATQEKPATAAASSTPAADGAPAERAEKDAVFQLYATRSEAMKRPDAQTERFVIVFKQSVRGLSVGAPVEFRGINIGEVISIHTEFEPKLFDFVQPVEIYLYPERLRANSRTGGASLPVPKTRAERIKRDQLFIEKGFRAQLRSANLLTGQLYIGVDFFPKAPKVKFDASQFPIEIPAIPGTFDELEETGARIVKKMDLLLGNIDTLVKRLDAETVPELNQTLIEARRAMQNAENVMASDSPLQTDLRDALRELTRTAASIKTLSDSLDRQPQSLIFGKPPEESKK